MLLLDWTNPPLTQLCTRIKAEASNSSVDLARIDRRMVDRAALLPLMLDQLVFAVEKQQMEFLDCAMRDIGLAVIDQLVPGADDVGLAELRFREAQRRVAYR